MQGLDNFLKVFLHLQMVCQDNQNVWCFKGTVLRDFRSMQMILIDRTWVSGIPLEVQYILLCIFSYGILLLALSFERVKLLLLHLAKA